MASEKNIFGQTNESNLHKVIRRVEEIWNRRFMHSNCVLNNTNKGQISKKSTKDGRIISIINKNIYPIKNSIIPKKRTYRKTNKNDKIIPEKLNMMQQREFGTLFQNEKSEKYKNKIINSTEKDPAQGSRGTKSFLYHPMLAYLAFLKFLHFVYWKMIVL
ncbi:uncharacterized protein LOC126905001 [Daktulosphaira vitifoliae]|uniref:uncharacterized protein LOC126905001 n=1 Tax=Daktulosphaira vitifoliae TaxID=58002 RepID=UPI0021AAC710|nr:uncharacterized protein LOC126905001 [Daktulosphaira vitifoliae]